MRIKEIKGEGANKTEGNMDQRNLKEKWKRAGNKSGTESERIEKGKGRGKMKGKGNREKM